MATVKGVPPPTTPPLTYRELVERHHKRLRPWKLRQPDKLGDW